MFMVCNLKAFSSKMTVWLSAQAMTVWLLIWLWYHNIVSFIDQSTYGAFNIGFVVSAKGLKNIMISGMCSQNLQNIAIGANCNHYG